MFKNINCIYKQLSIGIFDTNKRVHVGVLGVFMEIPFNDKDKSCQEASKIVGR